VVILPWRVKYWEIIADNLKRRGWSYGYVSAVDSDGRTIWIADGIAMTASVTLLHADEKLTAFIELEAVVVSRNSGQAV
jgi:hypothetical protein